MEAESEKLMLRAQHEPKDVSLTHDVFSSAHDSSEYLSEINERIDVLMSVRTLRLSLCDALPLIRALTDALVFSTRLYDYRRTTC